MKFLLVVCLTLLPFVSRAADWVPPENPDIDAIREEAERDVKVGKYDEALAKYVWLHENVLKYEPSMSGVRLSFALGDWYRLGEKYPPALAKMEEVRDAVGKRITANVVKRISFEDYQEFAAINRELGEEEKTVEMFKFVDQRNSKAAVRVFGVSEPALIKAKEYALCGKYLEPDESIKRTTELFQLVRTRYKDSKRAEMLQDFQTKKFINDAGTLVAILVVNNRQDEAQEALIELKKVEGDAKFHAKLAAALEEALVGKVPDPWP